MAEIDENTLIDEGGIPPDDFHQAIERIGEVSKYALNVPPDLEDRLFKEASHLLVEPETLLSAAAALQAGHLVLQGPPGTGKSSLARAICRAFNVSDMSVTAHEDWTIYEVIGRLELRVNADRAEEIEPVNGFFTESVIRCAGTIVRNFDDPTEPQAEWLVIDELNRAYMDRAFGELFTVLGTDELISVTLPHQRVGNRSLVVPRRYRIIATINSVDRQFVNSLSQAIRRRFSFISVDIPKKKPLSEAWGTTEKGASLANRELQLTIDRAAGRIASRNRSDASKEVAEEQSSIAQRIRNDGAEAIAALFEFAESLRYAAEESAAPFLPIGTATLIDTVELFATRLSAARAGDANPLETMDWACSVKIAPLLDSGSASPDVIKSFADSLKDFTQHTRQELHRIVASGMYYVE